jgi:zinc protease
MRDYVESYLASIPRSDESWNEWTDLGYTRPGKIKKTVYKGIEDQSRVDLEWFAAAPYSEELYATTSVLSEYLKIRLIEELRENLGGVYSIDVDVLALVAPCGELWMYVEFSCDPGRVEELIGAVLNLLNQIAAGDINNDVFGKSVEALQKEWETSIQDNSDIAESYAISSVRLNASLSRLDRRPWYYTAVTAEDIQMVCAQLLQDNNGPVQVVLMPESYYIEENHGR